MNHVNESHVKINELYESVKVKKYEKKKIRCQKKWRVCEVSKNHMCRFHVRVTFLWRIVAWSEAKGHEFSVKVGQLRAVFNPAVLQHEAAVQITCAARQAVRDNSHAWMTTVW